MLSSLSALVDRAFVVGFVLPVTIFSVALSGLFPEVMILAHPKTILAEDMSIGNVAFVVLILWLVALALSMLNTSIYRLIEGYYWPFKTIRKWHENEDRRRFVLQQTYDNLKAQLDDGHQPAPIPRPSDSASRAALYEKAQDTLIKLRTTFPSKDHPVLPTRLGNVIRAFERYPNDAYGADGVHLWALLYSVMPKDRREIIANTKAETDFFLNLSVLSVVIVGSSIVAVVGPMAAAYSACGVEAACWVNESRKLFLPLGTFVGALMVARVCYLLTIPMAVSWGIQVRAAFDLHLTTVAKQMGLTLPEGAYDRRLFWQRVAMQAAYLEPVSK